MARKILEIRSYLNSPHRPFRFDHRRAPPDYTCGSCRLNYSLFGFTSSRIIEKGQSRDSYFNICSFVTFSLYSGAWALSGLFPLSPLPWDKN